MCRVQKPSFPHEKPQIIKTLSKDISPLTLLSVTQPSHAPLGETQRGRGKEEFNKEKNFLLEVFNSSAKKL
jgi:hypothetical protein